MHNNNESFEMEPMQPIDNQSQNNRYNFYFYLGYFLKINHFKMIAK
jgi:hypothetical protein